ncbi:hypothetical protein HPP92_021672 [Vanilla planifolia]|uniref:Myb-like domain-containing protein n=1 Tax=Vanilla planifolia TaxID=51239 RepID=A0A835UKZ2_VANPL|nr:hypothetical protein HPP92_021672 [Vanilla planifolia]
MEEVERDIVQALPALCGKEAPLKRITRSLQSKANQRICNSQISPSSRCTRSQAAPEWTVQEVLVLLSVIASIDEYWLKALSSYQRWKMISDNCLAMDVVRSSNQCKRKWEMLLADYKKIRQWESQAKEDSYWLLKEDKKKHCGLPISFQKEVFDAMDAVIPVQQQSDSKKSDPEHLTTVTELEMPNVEPDLDSNEEGLSTVPKSPEKNRLIESTLRSEDEELITSNKSPEQVHANGSSEEETTNTKSPDRSRVILSRLHESAAQVCAILQGGDSRSGARSDSSCAEWMTPMGTEFARKQADELIKGLGGLTHILDEFCDLVKNGG